MTYPDPKPARFVHIRAGGQRTDHVLFSVCGRRVSWHKVVDARDSDRATCVKCAVKSLIAVAVKAHA